MGINKYKLAALTSHPIQYQVPLFRILAAHPNIDLTVYFCWDFGVKKEDYDPGFNRKIKWDIPLLTGYKYKFLPNLSPKPNSSFFGQVNPAIIAELRETRYDALWIHGYTTITNWLAFLGGWLSKTPILLRGESHLLNYRPLWKKVIKRAVFPLLFKNVSAFLTIGSLNQTYYKYYGVSDRKMFLTPYAVDNDFFSQKYNVLYKKRKQLKEDLGVDRELPVILYASKMLTRKRGMDLLRAYHLIQNKVGAQLLFIGDGVEKSLLEDYVRRHNLNNVYFLGFKNQTEIPTFYTISDFIVLPSTDEPWGLVINEVMNFGLPIVTTDKVGAAADLVRHGENGFIYPVGDIERLANCLLKLVTEPELRIKMGNRSLEVRSKWSYKEDVAGILAALEHIKKR